MFGWQKVRSRSTLFIRSSDSMSHRECRNRPCAIASGPWKDTSVSDDRNSACFPEPASVLRGLCAIVCLSGACLCWILTGSVAEAQAPPRTTPKAAPAPVAPAVDPNTGLPTDYVVPRETPDIMKIDKQLLSPDDRARIKREFSRNYQRLLWNGELRDDTSTANVRNGVRYRLNEMTLPENRKKITDLRLLLTGTGKDLSTAGRKLDKADAIREFRRKLMKIVVEETEQLFDNNLAVRVQAALILGELNLMEEDAAKGIKTEAYAPAAKPLCKVLTDPDQPQGVKIVCVLSLIRILNLGNPNVAEKLEIAQALVSELKLKPDEDDWWYQARLAEALAFVDVTLDLDREPFVFNALLNVVKDRDRHLQTRVKAAWALGRHPLEKTVNASAMTVEVAALALDLAQAQAAQPKETIWRRCAADLYLAFNPKDAGELNAKRDRPAGLRNEPVCKAAAEEAYAQVLPVVREMIAEKIVPPERVQQLGKWLQAKGHQQAPAVIKPAKAEPPKGESSTRTSSANETTSATANQP